MAFEYRPGPPSFSNPEAERLGLTESKAVGSRGATRVMIQSPYGTAFNGRTGVVVRVYDEGNIFVRLGGTTLPFGRSELKVLG
jgi:hypothetical protein